MNASEEVEKMLESGAFNPHASVSALAYMAERWFHDQLQSRRRREERVAEERTVQDVQRRIQVSKEAREKVSRLTSSIAAKAARQWTELLDQSFSLPSGERVTWRSATVPQHKERIEMLENLAARSAETAALHQSAISDIRKAGVSTLGEAI